MSSPNEDNVTKRQIPILTLGIGLAIVLLSIAIYYPGLNGPFVFDDLPNIVYNNAIHITQLSFSSLSTAAHSLHSGPLDRPLAAITFAINYYLGDGVTQTHGYKIFNLIVHIINGILIFWFVYLIISKMPKYNLFSPRLATIKKNKILFAGFCAILWTVHPIQVTSVLYVVQRMTSMAAMFMLLSLIAYIYARSAFSRRQNFRALISFLLAVLAGIAGAFSKETVILLFPYVLLIEFALFYEQQPWSLWHKLSKERRRVIVAVSSITFLLLMYGAIEFALPGYANRDFTISQRVLTESRILVFYIAQLFIPRLSEFGLYHDDITISTSLISPWTTLSSCMFIFAILLFAFRYRRKYPLLGFGVFWFFVSNSLESTFFPLELIHEHRNYLASLGPVLIVAAGIAVLAKNTQNNKVWLLAPLVIFIFGAATAVRTSEWGSLASLLEAEANNHPKSSRAWADLFSVQTRMNMPDKAITSIQKAIKLRPNEPGYYLLLYLYTKPFAAKMSTHANEMLLQHIPDQPDSIILANTLQKIIPCLNTSCKDLQQDFSEWVRTVLKYYHSPRYQYYLGTVLYFQGHYEDSLKFLDASIADGKEEHASPIIKRIQVLLALNRFDDAKTTFEKLEQLNKKYLYVSASDMMKLRQEIIEKARH